MDGMSMTFLEHTNKGGYIHIVVAIRPICALYKRMIPVNDAT